MRCHLNHEHILGDGILTMDFTLDCGQTLADTKVAYRLTGRPDGPLVVVQGGISAGRQVCRLTDDEAHGWWEDFVGQQKVVDTDHYLILSIDYLGGEGQTRCRVDRQHSGGALPTITTVDQANLIRRVVEYLGVPVVAGFIGASYGGMVALSYGALFPSDVAKLIVISAADRPHPMATGWRSIQRNIVRLGLDTNRVDIALSLARSLAMTTYRTAEEFDARFDGPAEALASGFRFPIEGYLEHHGQRFSEKFRPESFICLSESIDLHRVDVSRITAPMTVIGVRSDRLVPVWQLDGMAKLAGGDCTLHVVESVYGHDAFLKEQTTIGTLVTGALRCA
ncbi:MAG: homoserine O-succinyltransferase [Myxococcota bacterium]|nr:homoserine O-succinyltransferase [Myxococcota bacterium]